MHGILFIQDLAIVLLVAGVMGWIFQRAGLSVVAGFLAAGILAGPGIPALSLVSDVDGISTLAQVGLVFLMFSIGLRLNLRRLRRMGMTLLLSTFVGAIIMYYLSRLLAAAMGWNGMEGLFLAGMLMISSSAIIGKILHESGVNHERWGQLAMGVSILEDIVAVVVLTVLHSMVQLGDINAHRAHIGSTLAHLGAFVVLIGVVGLLLVPWFLRKMSVAAEEELQTVGIGALLFGAAVLAQNAGYSLALGAFLLGIIVAETPHRHQIERTFEGMRDIFTAVFFAAIGMQIRMPDLVSSAGLIVGLSVFTILVRPFAVACGVGLIGVPARDSLRAGLMAVPIGEFSFIIAKLGVDAGVVPSRFYPVAVGVSLLTTLAAPLLTRRADWIAENTLGRRPRWLGDWMVVYQGWMDRLRRQQNRSPLWRLSRKRFFQIGGEMLFVSGLLLFSHELFGALEGWLNRDWGFGNGPEVIFWSGLALLVLAPLVAIWRNCSALALLYAQVSTSGHPRARQIAPIIETGLKVISAGGMILWLVAILPAEETTRWVVLGSGLLAIVALVFLRRKLIYWHCVVEVELQTVIEVSDSRMSATTAPWLQPHPSWNLHMVDCTLPDLADCQGRRIDEIELRSRFGCSVVGIERQGFMIPLPGPETVLYPRDKVLLLGTNDQIRAGQHFLGAVSGSAPTVDSHFDEVRMEAITLAPTSRAAGQTLAELSPARAHGVHIAGIRRGSERILNPGGQENLHAGDELLALGTSVQISDFKHWLSEPA